METDILFNRREFIGFSALGTIGTVAEHVLEQPPLPTPNPTPMQEPPARPPAPEVVNFTADDFATRGPTFITLRWGAAARAESYEVRFTRADAEEIRPTPTNGGTFDGLLPSQNYSISVRSVNGAGASDWSPLLATCTRPAKPPSPEQGYNEMTQVGTNMLLLWNLSGVGMPAGAVVRLDKRREGEAISMLNQSPAPQGSFVDDGYTAGDFYALSLAVANPLAPGGVNRSARSEEIRPLRMVFAELRIPGEQEARKISTSYLRDYYA
jgi:hypothetical protein